VGGHAIHEAGIARNVIRIVEQAAVTNALHSVTRVVLEIGPLSGVEPEALELAFAALAPGSVMADAEIEVLTPPLILRCSHCEAEYFAHLDDPTCPVCEQEGFDVLRGREMIVRKVMGE
jgi:hydrogenase nickel incorporation protein HypA/HybF